MSAYDEIGGAPAVDKAVDIFYRKVLADDHINAFFEDVDMDTQAAKQKSFITMALGGPHEYTGLDMRAAHATMVKRGLTDSHFDAVVGHLGSTLTELGVADKTVTAIANQLEGLRTDILGR